MRHGSSMGAAAQRAKGDYGLTISEDSQLREAQSRYRTDPSVARTEVIVGRSTRVKKLETLQRRFESIDSSLTRSCDRDAL